MKGNMVRRIAAWDGWTEGGWLTWLEVAQQLPATGNATLTELVDAYETTARSIAAGELVGAALLDAIDYGNALSALIKARRRWGDYGGKGGVET